jgi:hypothetical protein
MDKEYSDWRKASYFNGQGSCVETASSADAWREFTDGLK